MTSVDKVNNSISKKLATYYISKCGAYEYRNGWMKGTCPHCGKEDKFGINLQDWRTNCFSCETKMSPLKLITKIEGFQTLNETYSYLNTFEDTTFLQHNVEIFERKKVLLPDGFRLITSGNSEFAKIARRTLRSRGFNITGLSYKGCGYCTSGKYKGYLIFPFYQAGNLIYFTTRRFVGAGPKFKNPTIEEFGIGKSSIIYNIDVLAIYSKIRLVESVTNCLTLNDNTIAIDGKVASQYQLSCILRSPAKTIDIILDLDAYQQAIELGLQLCPYKNVRVIKMESDQDINDIGKKETLKLIKSTPISSYRSLYKRYRQLITEKS